MNRDQSDHIWDSSGQITSTGSSNAYVIATAEPIAGYFQGMPPIRFKANFGNTGAATANIVTPNAPSGLGAVTMKKNGGASDLASGDIANGGVYTLIYDGTNFQVLELNPAVSGIINVRDFGADSTGTNDSASAIQAAIDAAAAMTTGRGTVYFPSGSGGQYKINSAFTWKPDVNIVCDPGVRIFAGAAMDAMLQTGTGDANRLRNVWLRGGRWDGAYLARRGFWIKDGNGVHLSNFLIRAIGAYSDGSSETESSYIRIGDPSQFTSCYEVMISDFGLYRTDDAASPTPAPANNYGIHSSDGASDCHVTNGVISGVETGIADELAHWKISLVHVWNFQADHGALQNAFYDSIGGVIFTGCQVDCATYEIPFRFDGTAHPNAMVGCQINCSLDTASSSDNVGLAVSVAASVQLAAIGNTITCDASKRFAVDYSVNASAIVQFSGNQTKNVVAPVGNGVLTTDRVGYRPGAGGTVTQATSKSTGVTLDKICGRITMHNATLNAGAEVGFTVSNSLVAEDDVVVPNISGGATFDSYLVGVDDVSNGSFRLTLTNTSGTNRADAVVINFAVFKAVTS